MLTRSLAAALIALPAVAWAAPVPAPQCPSITDIAAVLKDSGGQVPVASWLQLDGTTMQMFADPAGRAATLVIIAGDCAYPVGQGMQLRTWVIVGGETA